MVKLPKKYLIDTNIPITANWSVSPEGIPDELVACVQRCVHTIEHVVMKKGSLVLDDGDEIFSEYRKKLSFSGQPGMGDAFLKWVHDNRWNFPPVDRVEITVSDDSYDQFPDHPDLISFDDDDRKFVAVSNAHPEKPPILQGTDSEWLRWEEALLEVGIKVVFICNSYVKQKYMEKF